MGERFVDPNSGAAPQPGGVAAPQPGGMAGPAEAGEEKAAEVSEEKAAEVGEETPSGPPVEPRRASRVRGEVDYSELLEKTLPEIEEYVEEHPKEKDAVIAAERQREKPRKGVLEL